MEENKIPVQNENSAQNSSFTANVNPAQNTNPAANMNPYQNSQFQYREAYFMELREKQDRHRNFGIAYFGKIWFVPLIFGAMFPFCLYKNENGIFWVLFMAVALLLVHIVAKRLSEGTINDYEKVDYLKRDRSKFSIFCKFMLMALSVLICTTMSNEITAYSELLMLALTLLYLWNVFAPKEPTGLINTIRMMFLSFFSFLVKLPDPVTDMSHYIKEKKAEEKTADGRNGTGRAVALGLLISIPVLIIVIALLAQADMVFGRAVKNFTRIFSFTNIDDIFFVIVYIILGIWFSYCVVSWLIDDNQYYVEKKAAEKHKAVSAISFSIPLTIVYVIFILIQLIFLLGHFELPKGMTYSEYAHEGFYQLLAVAIINLAIILIIQYHFEENKVLKTFLMIISLCTYGMIFSSAARMFMYIDAYGLTFLRVFVLLFLLILSIWLFAAITKIYKPHVSVMRFCIIIASVFFLIFGFSHPDFWIAKYNLALYQSKGITYEDYQKYNEEVLDYYADSIGQYSEPSDKVMDTYNKYLEVINGLSYDSVPAATSDEMRKEMVKSYHNLDILYSNGNSFSLYSDEEPDALEKLRNFNFSRYFAEKSLK